MSRLHMSHTHTPLRVMHLSPLPMFTRSHPLQSPQAPAVPQLQASDSTGTSDLQSEGPTRKKQAFRSYVLRIKVRQRSDHQT